MRKANYIMTGIALTTLALAGCSTSNQGVTSDENTYVIGLDDTFAPMGFRDDKGELVGFDVDLANAVGEDLGYEFTFQSIDWAMKETELNTGNIDMIWNGYTITDERAEKVAFSDSYLENSQLIITLEDSGIEEKTDLAGKNVAAQQSSSAVNAIEADSTNILSEFSNREVIQFPSNNDVFNDLLSERSDAIVVDETMGRYYMSHNPSTRYKVLEDNFGDEKYAIGFRKDDALKDEINASLEKLKENGTYDDIYDIWFD